MFDHSPGKVLTVTNPNLLSVITRHVLPVCTLLESYPATDPSVLALAWIHTGLLALSLLAPDVAFDKAARAATLLAYHQFRLAGQQTALAGRLFCCHVIEGRLFAVVAAIFYSG